MVRYIFCINPGRSGSEYLQRLFSCVNGVTSFHEPEPILNGMPMERFLLGDDSLMRNAIQEKVKFMRNETANGDIYFESNHCFIKGFGWLLPEHFKQEEIAVVILKRDKKKVVESLLRVNANPFNTTGRKWIIVPQFYKQSITRLPDGYSSFRFYLFLSLYRIFNKLSKFGWGKVPDLINQFSLNMISWYVDETYALGDKFKIQYPRITSVVVDLDSLNSIDGFQNLLSKLGVTNSINSGLIARVGSKVNMKESLKQR